MEIIGKGAWRDGYMKEGMFGVNGRDGMGWEGRGGEMGGELVVGEGVVVGGRDYVDWYSRLQGIRSRVCSVYEAFQC